jgi:hypothetical protein
MIQEQNGSTTGTIRVPCLLIRGPTQQNGTVKLFLFFFQKIKKIEEQYSIAQALKTNFIGRAAVCLNFI